MIPTIDLPNATDSQKVYVEIIRALGATNTSLNDVQHVQANHEKDIKRLEEVVITGNGEKALRERVRTLEQDEEKRQKWQDFIAKAVVTQTISFLVVVLSAGIAFFVKIYPVLEQLAKKP
jgi:DNA gyrase/topoisomerase IV subunit A